MPIIGLQVLAIAKWIGMMKPDYVWTLIDGIINELNSLNLLILESMEGVLVVKPYVPRIKDLDNFKA